MAKQQTGTRLAQDKWRRAGDIARRAGSDERDYSDEPPADSAARQVAAKRLGETYYLEMVDQKHRYGSNLRAYHRVWQESDTRENFFYWLDYGQGREVDLDKRPRHRLDSEQVRYLSK